MLRPGGRAVLALPNILSLKGLVTRFTPWWFHVWVYRRVLGDASVGTDGIRPVPHGLSLRPPPGGAAAARRGIRPPGRGPAPVRRAGAAAPASPLPCRRRGAWGRGTRLARSHVGTLRHDALGHDRRAGAAPRSARHDDATAAAAHPRIARHSKPAWRLRSVRAAPGAVARGTWMGRHGLLPGGGRHGLSPGSLARRDARARADAIRRAAWQHLVRRLDGATRRTPRRRPADPRIQHGGDLSLVRGARPPACRQHGWRRVAARQVVGAGAGLVLGEQLDRRLRSRSPDRRSPGNRGHAGAGEGGRAAPPWCRMAPTR